MVILPSYQWVVGYLSYVVTTAIVVRILSPRIRKKTVYKMLTLFDVYSFAQVIRRKMNGVGRSRQAAMVLGTALHFGSVLLILFSIVKGVSLTNLDNGLTTFVPPLLSEITIGGLIVAAIFGVNLWMSNRLISYGYYGKATSMTSLARTLSTNYGRKAAKAEAQQFWPLMTTKQKICYGTVLTVGFSLLMVEMYALGFIMSPAQTFGTTLEPKFEAMVLKTFGSMTNALLAEVAVLGSVGLTLGGMTFATKRITKGLSPSDGLDET